MHQAGATSPDLRSHDPELRVYVVFESVNDVRFAVLLHITWADLWCEDPAFFVAAAQPCQVCLLLCPSVGSATSAGVKLHRLEEGLDYNAQVLQLWL